MKIERSLLLGVLGLLAPHALGQGGPAPEVLHFQARLVDAAGLAVNDPALPVVVRLWDASSGGVVLFAEAHVVSVGDGLLDVAVGSLTSLPAGLLDGGQDLYLGLGVGSDGEMVPRHRLGSAPFAPVSYTHLTLPTIYSV